MQADESAPMKPAVLMELLLADRELRTPHTFKAPALPPGVVPPEGERSPKHLALDSASMQGLYGYLNQGILCGMGFPGYQALAELSQKSEYRAPAETTATEIMRRGFELTGDNAGDKSKKIKELTQDLKDFGIREHLTKIIHHEYFFGRAQLLVSMKTSGKNGTKLPLLLKPETVAVGSLKGFAPVEPMWTSPLAWNAQDPSAPDFYKPTSWYVLGKEWHSTRCLTFIGRELPDMLKPAYNFSGISMSQLIEPYVQRWLQTVDNVAAIIRNYSKLGLKTNMQQALAGERGAAADLVKRLQLYIQAASSRGILAIDKNAEEMFLLNTPLSGLHELQAQSQEHMSGPTHIPLVKMFGVTPAGLNATSEGEIAVWYDWCDAFRKSFLGLHLDSIVKLLQLNRYGKIDDGITIKWPSLSDPTEVERSTIRKTDADTAAAYITVGVVTNEEVRQRLQDDPDSGYDNLQGPAPEAPEEAEHARGEEAAAVQHERGEEAAAAAHERTEEAAETQHERDKELARIDAAKKAK